MALPLARSPPLRLRFFPPSLEVALLLLICEESRDCVFSNVDGDKRPIRWMDVLREVRRCVISLWTAIASDGSASVSFRSLSRRRRRCSRSLPGVLLMFSGGDVC